MAKAPTPASAKASSPAPLQYCPRCFRVEPELGPEHCGNFALGCPQFEPLDDSKVVLMACQPCGKTRAVPLENVMKRRRLDELGNCVSDRCQGGLLHPSSSATGAPPPIRDGEPSKG